jgi:hypothetical protein
MGTPTQRNTSPYNTPNATPVQLGKDSLTKGEARL